MAKQKGLYQKYRVARVDGNDMPGKKHENCRLFVLDVTHDPHAIAALQAYAGSCAKSNPDLAADLRELAAQAHAGILGQPKSV